MPPNHTDLENEVKVSKSYAIPRNVLEIYTYRFFENLPNGSGNIAQLHLGTFFSQKLCVLFLYENIWNSFGVPHSGTVKSLLDAQALINAHPPIWMLKMAIFLDNSRIITASIKRPLEKKDLTLCWKFPNLLLDRRTQKSFSLVVQIKS